MNEIDLLQKMLDKIGQGLERHELTEMEKFRMDFINDAVKVDPLFKSLLFMFTTVYGLAFNVRQEKSLIDTLEFLYKTYSKDVDDEETIKKLRDIMESI